MLTLDLVLVLLMAGLVVGLQFRVLAMAPLALVACVCAFFQALAIGASASDVAFHVTEAAVFFEVAYAAGAFLMHGRRLFLPSRYQM